MEKNRQRSSEFILLMFELNGLLYDRGHPLADTDKGIAEAARNSTGKHPRTMRRPHVSSDTHHLLIIRCQRKAAQFCRL